MLREIIGLLIAGVVLWITFVGGNIVAVFIVSVLPLAALGAAGDILGFFLLIIILGAVGKFGVKYM